MKLLHPEVDITPGQPGTRQAMTPVQEGVPLPGSAVVRLNNTTTQNNAYTVRLRCDDNTFWQESWYRLLPLPPAPGEKNTIPAGKRDELGPQGATLKLYILSGGTREVLIQFNVPKSPGARAGHYAYQVEIETQVLNAPNEAARRESRITRLPGTALVRPFYNWSFDLKKTITDPRPGEPPHVGRYRSTATLELVVTNESNDWLYCDVLLPQLNDVDLVCFDRRLAVRPPELGELLPAIDTGGDTRNGIQRYVPVSVRSRLKTLRGNPTTQLLPLSLQRVDAPSVAPPVDNEFFVGTGKVICRPTSEKQSLPGERAIVYHPPIPATLTEFFQGLVTSGRTLIMSAIGLVIAAHMFILMYQQIYYQNLKVNLQGEQFPLGATVTVDGKFLNGAIFSVGNKTDGYDHVIDEANVKPVKGKLNEFVLTLPADQQMNGKRYDIRAQRTIPFLPYLNPLLRHADSRSFDYGTAPVVQMPKAEDEDRTIVSGQQTFTIHGQHLGQPGTVFVNNIGIHTSSWKDDLIVASVPRALKPDDPMPVEVQPDGVTTRVPAGSITLNAGHSAGNDTGKMAGNNDTGKDAGSDTGKNAGKDTGKDAGKDNGKDTGTASSSPTLGQVATGPYKPGQSFTIPGQNLKSGTVRLADRIIPSEWSPNQITATVPGGTGPGTLPVVAQPEGGSAQNVGLITVVSVVQPQQATITPISGLYHPGDSLKLTGQALGNGGTVYLSRTAIPLQPGAWSDTQITLTIPSQIRPGSVAITVLPTSGGRLRAGRITIEAQSPPSSVATTAYDALAQGDNGAAADLANRQLSTSGLSVVQQAEAYAVRGFARIKQQQLVEGKDDIDKADALSILHGQRARALSLAAKAFRYAITGEQPLKEAKKLSEGALKADPGMVVGATTLAQIDVNMGNKSEARNVLQKFVREHRQEALGSALFKGVWNQLELPPLQ